MQQTFGGPDHVGFAAVNEEYEINAFYAELFNFFICHGYMTLMSHKGSQCRL